MILIYFSFGFLGEKFRCWTWFIRGFWKNLFLRWLGINGIIQFLRENLDFLTIIVFNKIFHEICDPLGKFHIRSGFMEIHVDPWSSKSSSIRTTTQKIKFLSAASSKFPVKQSEIIFLPLKQCCRVLLRPPPWKNRFPN